MEKFLAFGMWNLVRIGIGNGVQVDHVFPYPLGVILHGGEAIFQLVIANDAAFCGVYQQHFTGLHFAFIKDGFDGFIEDAGFAGEDHAAIFHDPVASGAQAVAIEGCADLDTVGEANGGRAVPGFHKAGVIFVIGAFGGVHGGIIFPGFGDQHGDGVGQGASALNEKFEGIIEGGGVAAGFGNEGAQFVNIGKKRALEIGEAGGHPIAVATHSVNFTVVGDHAVGVGQLPAWEGIGGETAVDEAEGAFVQGVFEVGEKLLHLVGNEHTLVNDGLAGHAACIIEFGFGALIMAQAVVGNLADQVQGTFKVRAGGGGFRAADKDLSNDGHGFAGNEADGLGINGDVAPAYDGLAFFVDDGFEGVFAFSAGGGICGEEDHSDAIIAGVRKLKAEFACFMDEEVVRYLSEDACTITGFGVAATGPAVSEVIKNGEGLADCFMGFAPFDIHDKSNAAGVVFQVGVIESPGKRQAVLFFHWSASFLNVSRSLRRLAIA